VEIGQKCPGDNDCFLDQSLRARANEPAHGLQAGKASSAGESVSLVRPEPSEFIA
jgi:hypothetical protein